MTTGASLFRLRVKTWTGEQHILSDVIGSESSIQDLKEAISNITSVPVCNQKLLTGSVKIYFVKIIHFYCLIENLSQTIFQTNLNQIT